MSGLISFKCYGANYHSFNAFRRLAKRGLSTGTRYLRQEFAVQQARYGVFNQTPPQLGNQFIEDAFLKANLQRILPQNVYTAIEPDLEQFGQRVSDDIFKLGYNAELNPPKLKQLDAWGNRVDDIVVSNEWRKLKEISAEEGLIAIGYENRQQEWSRMYQAAKLYLFSASSGLFSCPLAMTDGAAKTIQNSNHKSNMLKKAYQNLTTRNPELFWTSGQWMTEKKGGSDVGYGTETVAKQQTDGTYKLYGYKWFSSATDADMCLTLARILDQHGNFIPGSKGLSLFYVETKSPEGKLNGIQIQHLKNKLGTRQLPTAELVLDGTIAHKISDDGRGVSEISNMLTMSRIHNSISSVSPMRRILAFARDYATRRYVFNKYLCDHPLHMQTLARMELQTRAALSLVLEIARLLGLQENNKASETDVQVLRLLTTITKLYTAKQAVAVTSEGLEALGGQGYIEDTGYPGLLRDAQVLPIWEGTTNILSLDVLRAISKSNGQVIEAFKETVLNKLNIAREENENVAWLCDSVQTAVTFTTDFLSKAKEENPTYLETAARDLANTFAGLYAASLLIEHAAWSGADESDYHMAKRWCIQDLCPIFRGQNQGAYIKETNTLDYAAVMKGHPHFK